MPGRTRPLIDAIDRLLEATRRQQRDRALRPIEVKLEAQVKRAFLQQGRLFVKRLGRLKAKFPPGKALPGNALKEADFDDDAIPEWEADWKKVMRETSRLFEGPISQAARQAMKQGGLRLIGSVAATQVPDVSTFTLKNPRAIAFLKRYAADRVTRVNDTTRDAIKRIIVDGVESGQSYDQIARAITGQFREFAVGKPQEHIESRAHLVAVTETSNAYQEGNMIVARDLKAAGLEMEKYWLNSGDGKVSDGCLENTDAGWIPIDDAFPSGDQRPPRFPGCRCDLEIRRKPDRGEGE